MKFNYCPGENIRSEDTQEISFRLVHQVKDKNLTALRSDLENTTFVLTKLIDLIHDKRIAFPMWMRHIEALMIKLVQHTVSLNHLAVPLPLFKTSDGVKKVYFDTASQFVIARAQIETFLTFYYLIISPKTYGQGEFYDLVYELSGLCGRQGMPATSKLSQRQKSVDAIRIAQLRKRVEGHPFLSNVEKGLRGKIMGNRPPARLYNGWEDLIRQSHLNEQFFLSQWKYYSGYAHSEFISSMQLPAIFEDPQYVFGNVVAVIQMALVIVSVAVIELLNLVPELQDDYGVLWDVEQRMRIWFYSNRALKPDIKNDRDFVISSAAVN